MAQSRVNSSWPWENAGGSTILGPDNRFKNRIASLSLDTPQMVAVQIGRDTVGVNISDGNQRDIFATINWQVGRGTHSATVDIARGTYIVLAAAQAVDVYAEVRNYDDVGGNTVLDPLSITTNQGSVVCTISPASAPNPVPATRTQHFLATAGVITTPATPPNFAKSVQFICSNTTGTADPLPNMVLEWRGSPSSGDPDYLVPLASGIKFPVLNGVDSFAIRNTNAANHDIFAVWELAL